MASVFAHRANGQASPAGGGFALPAATISLSLLLLLPHVGEII